MAKTSTPADTFPIACKNCGGQLFGRIKFCPYCGKSEAIAFGLAKPPAQQTPPRRGPPPLIKTSAPAVAAEPATEAAPKRVESRLPARFRKASDATPQQEAKAEPSPAEPMEGVALRLPPPAKPSKFGKWVVLAIVPLSVIFAYDYYSRHNKSEKQTHEHAEKLNQAQDALTKGDLAGAERVLAVLLAEKSSAADAQALKEKIAERRKEVAADLRKLRSQLERNETADARRTLDGVFAKERDNAEARSLNDQVAKREKRRDADLKTARGCLQTSDWSCAARNANSALAVDRSSDEAKQISERLTQLGLAQPSTSPAPGSAAQKGTTVSPQQSECEAIVRAGRRALESKSYDQAVASANEALVALNICPGAQQLKQDALRARDAARRKTVRE